MVYNETFDSEFYHSLSLFKLSLKLSLAAGLNGGRKSNAKGSSVEFSDFREYIPGDDIRRIDWNAYARFDRLFVKLFMEEKEGIFRIFFDASASMDYGEVSKARLAKQIAAALSYCILDSSDRVILNVLQNDTCQSFKGVTGKQGFSKIIDNLSALECTGANDLLKSLQTASIKERGMSIVISDFYTENLEDILRFLTIKKQEVFIVQVLSKEEMDPALTGTLGLTDLETKALMKVTESARLEKDYKKTVTGFLENTKALCQKYGARYVFADTRDTYEKVLRG